MEILVLIMLYLQVKDFKQTRYAVNNLGVYVEKNKIARGVINLGGFIIFGLIKLAMVIGMLMWYFYERFVHKSFSYQMLFTAVMMFLAVHYTIIIYRNHKVNEQIKQLMEHYK